MEHNLSNVGCDYCLLKDICLKSSFCTKSDHSLSSKYVFTNTINLKKNSDRIYFRNISNNIYIINSGIVKASRHTMDGHEQILSFYFPGEILGYEFFHRKNNNTSIEAVKSTQLCEIDHSTFLPVLQENKEVLYKFMLSVSNRIFYSELLSNKIAQQRVAGFLLMYKDRVHTTKNNQAFSLYISQNDIANHLCLAPETLSRIMSMFNSTKLIQSAKKQIRILDEQQLRNIAEA